MKFLIFITLFLPCFALLDDDQRNIFLPIAASAYSDNPSECFSKALKYFYCNDTVTFTIYRQYSVKCESLNDTCSAYLAYDTTYPSMPRVFIVFRGTNNNYDIIERGWNYTEMVPIFTHGKVGKVFFDAFYNLWDGGRMKEDVMTLANKFDVNIFYVLGHSLGGALASITTAALDDLNSLYSIFLYTFGQPRVGDAVFANAINYLPDYSNRRRFVHKADVVPHYPPVIQSADYYYYHHGQEKWYNNDMGIHDLDKVCHWYDGEDPTCSNSLPASDYNMEDHKNYYGRDVIQYGLDGCPDIPSPTFSKKVSCNKKTWFKKNGK